MERSALPVFLSVPYPAVNGITTYSIYLARGLARLGYPARILLTEADTTLASYAEQTLELPADVAVERLAVGRLDGWGAHWGALIRRLEESAPCVYVPNSDFRHSVVSPALSSGVIVVGVAHADEPLHYDHVARLGRYWNRIVCVSGEVAARLRERQPELAERIVAIRNGIEVPEGYPEGRRFGGRLELVYHGSFKQQQKRVLEFPALLRAVRGRGVEARLTLIGSGPDEGALREAGRELVAEGVLRIEGPMANEALRERLREFHVYVLNSEFEGMPQALLEAMSQGCVPVVTDVSSGTREVVEEGESGFLVGVGDFGAFAERIAALDADRGRLARLSRRAHAALGERGLRLADMAGRYDALFGELVAEQRAGGFVREAGPIGAPPGVVGGLSVFPLELLAHDARYGRFPSWGDLEEFEWERFCQGGGALSRAQAHPVYLALRELGSGYATELALELGEALRGRGFDARLVCLRPPPPHALRAPAGLPVETVCGQREIGWAGAAARTLRWLESRGAASYLAFDRETAGLAPRLGPALRTLALANGCDVEWLHASGLAAHVDGLVLPSQATAAAALPDGSPASLRSSVIPYPIHGRSASAPPPAREGLTVLAYLGHLDGLAPDPAPARAVLDALGALEARVRPLRFLLAAPPESALAARDALGEPPAGVAVEVVECAGGRELRPHLEAAHVLLVPCALPDVSALVLDALGHGCVLVGAHSPALAAGLPAELAANLVPGADPRALAQRIGALAAARERLAALAAGAAQEIGRRYPGSDEVAERWIRLLARVWHAAGQAAAPRAPGPIFPPESGVDSRPLIHDPRFGHFRSWGERGEFEWELLCAEPGVVERQRQRPLLLAISDLGAGYSAELALELAGTLRAEGYDARLLCLRPPPPEAPRPPADLPVEIASAEGDAGEAGSSARALRLVRAHGACTLMALDRETARLTPRLDAAARSVVLVDDVHWLRESELARHADGVVVPSLAAEAEAFPDGPPASLCVADIPYPVHALDALPAARGGARLGVLVYLGHLDGVAPDLRAARAVLEPLARGSAALRVVLALPPGWLDEGRETLRELAGLEGEVVEVASGAELRPQLEAAHLLLVPTVLPGISAVLLDALGHGCLPVLPHSEALARALPDDLAAGLVAAAAPAALAARALALAASRPRLHALAEASRARIRSRHLGPQGVTERWVRLLARVWFASEQATRSRVGERVREHPVLLAVRHLGSSYATELALELAATLREDGYDARLVCLWRPPPDALRPPPGVPLETLCPEAYVDPSSAAARLLRCVGALGACTYLAFDPETAELAPRLDACVRTLALAGSGDLEWLRTRELPAHLDGLVLSSPEARACAFPQPAPPSLCVEMIPYPVHGRSLPLALPDDRPLTVLVYLGHLDGLAPDLPAARAVLAALAAQGARRPPTEPGARLRCVVAVPPDALGEARAALADVAGSTLQARRARSEAQPSEVTEPASPQGAQRGTAVRSSKGLARSEPQASEVNEPWLELEVVAVASSEALRAELEAAALLLAPSAFPVISLVVLEALGHGCLPVGGRSPGLAAALPEGLDVGLVASAAPAALAERIFELAAAPERRHALAERSRRQSQRQQPGLREVADRWLHLLVRVWAQSEQESAPRARVGERQRQHPVFLAVRDLGPSHASELACELAAALREDGYDARLLCLRPPAAESLAPPPGLPVERVCEARHAHWTQLAARTLRRVAAEAECTYVAFDRDSACLAPRLGAQARTVVLAGVHDVEWLRASGLPDHVDALAFTSQRAESSAFPDPDGRSASRCVSMIPFAVHASALPVARRDDAALDVLVYLGHLDGAAADLAAARAVLASLGAAGPPLRCLVAVPPRQGDAARDALAGLPDGVTAEPLEIASNQALRARFEAAHLLLVPVLLPYVSLAVLDALGHGCLPVGVRSPGLEAALPEELSVGLVDAAEPGALAERIRVLAGERPRLRVLGERARRFARKVHPGPREVADRWIHLLVRAWEASERAVAPSAAGPLYPPYPEQLGGPLVHDPRYGRFDSWGDVGDFEWELFCEGQGVLERQRQHPLLLALRDLGSSYAAEVAVELAGALRGGGWDARLLCLRPAPARSVRVPAGVPVETVCERREVGWAGAAARALRFVEGLGPATYVAFDREAACLAPRLPAAVRSVVRADGCDVAWLGAGELAGQVDGLVFSSVYAEGQAFPEGPPVPLCVATVPYPVHVLSELPASRGEAALTVLAYLGHLDGAALDVGAMVAVLGALAGSGLRVELALPREALEGARASLRGVAAGVAVECVEVASRLELRPHLARAALLLVPVAFADISLVFLDALGHGCLPVGLRSPGLAGALPEELAVGLVESAEGLAGRLRELAGSRPALRALAEQARRRMAAQHPGASELVERWVRLFGRVWSAGEQRALPRARGLLFPPYPDLSDPAALREKLVRIPELGAFVQRGEWQEFEAQWAAAGETPGGRGRLARGRERR